MFLENNAAREAILEIEDVINVTDQHITNLDQHNEKQDTDSHRLSAKPEDMKHLIKHRDDSKNNDAQLPSVGPWLGTSLSETA